MKKITHLYIYCLLLVPYIFILINYTNIPTPNKFSDRTYITIDSLDYVTSTDFYENFDYYFENEHLNWTTSSLPVKFANYKENNLILSRILLPDNLTSADFFVVQSKNQIFEIYVNKQMIYSFGHPNKDTKISSHGVHFSTIRLSPEFSNQHMYIYIQPSIYDNMGEITSAYIGDRASIAINNYFTFNHKLIISCFLLANTIILFIIHFSAKNKENNNLIPAALLTLSLSLYYFSKSTIISLYIQNSSIIITTEYIAICSSKIYLLSYLHGTINAKKLKPFFNFVEIITFSFISLILVLSLSKWFYFSDFHNLIETMDFILIPYVLAIIAICAVFFKETEAIYMFKGSVLLGAVIGVILLLDIIFDDIFIPVSLINSPDAGVIMLCFYLNFSIIKKSIIKYNKLTMFNHHLTANNQALDNLSKSKVIFDEIKNENILFKSIFNELYSIFNEKVEGFVVRIDINNIMSLLYDTNINKGINYYKQFINESFEYNNFNENKIVYNKNCSLINLSTDDTETILLYVKKETPFDTYIFNIFYDNILNSLNNIKIYNTMQKEQKEVVTFIGKVLDDREANKSNCLAVYEICKILAKNLGFNETKTEDISLASCINRVGKFGINEEILVKEESELNAQEYEKLISHHEIGYTMLSKLSGEIMFIAFQMVKDYYENFDGSGLKGLKGEDINVYARIVRVAYDLVVYVNKCKKSDNYDFDKCLIYLIDNSNIYFDPKIIKIVLDNRVKLEHIIDTHPSAKNKKTMI